MVTISGALSHFHVLVTEALRARNARSLTQCNLSNARNYQPCSEVWDTFREILLLPPDHFRNRICDVCATDRLFRYYYRN